MNVDFRRRLVHRLDILFFVGLLITSGSAAVLFSSQFYANEDKNTATQTPTTARTAAPSATPTATLTWTPTPTVTLTSTATLTPTVTLTSTATLTASVTASSTPTPTRTPWPAPVVNPLALAGTYAGEPIRITGTAFPGDTIQVYDQDTVIAATTADSSGAWQVELAEGLPEGNHHLSVAAVGPDGSTSQRVEVGFQVVGAPTNTPSWTPTHTATLTSTFTATASPTPTVTNSPTPRPTWTVTNTPTGTDTAAASALLPTGTPTATVTASPTATESPTSTLTVTASPTVTSSPTNTLTATASPLPPSKTPIPPTSTLTQTPSQTPSPAQTGAAVALVPSNTVTPTAVLPAAPVINALDPAISIFDPFVIDGLAKPGLTVQVAANGDPVGEAAVQSDGTWSLTWIGNIVGPVEITAVAVEADGRSSAPATAQTELIAPRPRIDAPASGEVLSPGLVTVRGIAPPGAVVEIYRSNQALAEAQASDQGVWQTAVELPEEGQVTLTAMMPGPGNFSLASDPVTITLALSVPPNTGQGDNPQETGRTFTALLALLLSAGGFSAYFAGRLIYMLAQDRMKSR